MTNTTTRLTPAAAVERTAWSMVERINAQGMKGKRAETAAMEMAAGALAATIAVCGEDDPQTHAMSMFAFLVSTRGLAYVRARAGEHVARQAGKPHSAGSLDDGTVFGPRMEV